MGFEIFDPFADPRVKLSGSRVVVQFELRQRFCSGNVAVLAA